MRPIGFSPRPFALAVAAPRPARLDTTLTARVVSRTPLRYADGAKPALDRPAHVRAASGCARVQTAEGPRLCVVQDDANFLALVDPARGRVEGVALPAGPGGARTFDDARGNKKDKLDLECAVVLPSEQGPVMLALGSGSAARREKLVLANWQNGTRPAAKPDINVVDDHGFYEALRRLPGFAGKELNLEGAALVDGTTLRLFQRGNGSGSFNATVDVDAAALLRHLRDPARVPVPPLSNPQRHDLGAVGGVPLGFTDAVSRGPEVLFLSAAEASPDATRDGPVAGTALGCLDGQGTRYALLKDERGQVLKDKVEGIALDPANPRRLFLVVDKDDPAVASELCVVEWDAPA